MSGIYCTFGYEKTLSLATALRVKLSSFIALISSSVEMYVAPASFAGDQSHLLRKTATFKSFPRPCGCIISFVNRFLGCPYRGVLGC
jgi:hypothetical protein